LPADDDKGRLWELQQKVANLVGSMDLSAPPILAVGEELDAIVNRIMGITGRSAATGRS